MACLFAWAFELTPEGMKRSKEVNERESITRHTGRSVNRYLAVALSIAIGFIVFNEVGRKQLPFVSNEIDPSIAVLAFEDMSPGKTEGYFAEGVAEEILNLLAKTDGLQVAARTSSFAFRGVNDSIETIGRKLGVAHVLEGSVRRHGNAIRVTAQLINSETGYHLWSETYDRELDNIFVIQDEIAASILDALKKEILGLEVARSEVARHTATSVEAYGEFLLGKELLLRRERVATEQSLQHFARAIEIEPGFALPYAYSVMAWMRLERIDADTLLSPKPEARKAEFVERAMTLAPLDPEVLAINGLYASGNGRPDEALDFLNRAIALRPSHALAYVWRAGVYEDAGEYPKMLADRERAYELDPVSISVAQSLIYAYRNYQRYDDIDKIVDRLEIIHPKHEQLYLIKIRNFFVQTRWSDMALIGETAIQAHPSHKEIEAWTRYAYLQLGLIEKLPDDLELVEFHFLAMSSPGEQHRLQFRQAIDEIFSESPDALSAVHMDMHYQAMYGNVETLTAAVDRYAAASEREGSAIPSCDPAHGVFFSQAGRADLSSAMLSKCRLQYEPAIEKGYLCNCSWLNLMAYQFLKGDDETTIVELKDWLEAGNSNRLLFNHDALKWFFSPDKHVELMQINERTLDRHRDKYLAAKKVELSPELN